LTWQYCIAGAIYNEDNNTKNDKTVKVNMNLGGAIFLVLLILKLTETVTWSWWIIFLPIWLPVAIVLGFLGIAGIIRFLIALLD